MSKDNLPKAQSGKVVTGSPGQLSSPNPLIDEQFMQDRYGGYRSPAVDGSPLPSVAYTNPYNTGTDDSKNSSALANLLKFANTERDPGKGGKLRTLDEYAGNEKGRYDFFMPGDFDNEDAVAQNQSFGSKMVNGVGKGLLLTGTTFLQSTVGLVNGTAKAIADGKFSSFYDNEFNRALDEINKKAEDALPNYYTAAERDASWYSPKYWATGNFMWDGVVKNLGFAAGAALSGGAYTKALSSLPYASRLFSVGKSAETLAATETALAGASKVTDTYGKILNLSNKFASNYSYLNKGGRVVVAGLATTGEAGIEALHSSNEFRKELIDAHVAEFGIEPTGLALKEINDATEGSGNATFFANMGLLTATNYIQFPKILGSTYSGEKSIVTGLVREIDDIVLEGGKYALPKAKYPFLSKLNKIRPYTFSTSEAFEEVSQYTATVATQDYYKKALNGEATSWMNSIGVGITEGAFSDEGAKNALIGGISGTLMLSKGRYQKNKAREMSTAAALKEFNNVKLSDFTKETIDAVNRGTVIQKEREQEIKDGNIIGSKNLEADYIINYLTPRIKYGRYDLIKSDINEYKNLASTEEGFAQLQSEGKALESDTREAYVERLNRFEQTAEDVKSLYQSLNLRYGSEIKKDKDGNPIIEDGKKFLKYGPDVMNQMIYAASKVSDLDKRIVDLMAPLTAAGINTSEVLNQLAQGDPAAFNEAVNNISQMDILNEDKETFGKALDDIAELSLSRQSFLKAYQDIKDNPDKFILYRPEDATNASGPVETVSVKTKQGQRDIELNTEYFAGKGVDYNKDSINSPVPISRFSILGVDKDGKLKIKNLDTGKESEISTEEFANLKVGKVSILQADSKANYFYEHRNELFEYNFGKPLGGIRKGRLEYQDGNLYFVYLTPKGKVTKKEVNISHFVAQKGFDRPRIKPIGGIENQGQKTAEELFLSPKEIARQKLTLKKNREARLEALSQLGEEAKENLDEANDTISKSKEKLAKVREDLSNIQKMKETGDKIKLNFSKATKSFTKAINNLTSMQAELTEMINNAELEKEELEFNISYFQDFANEIDDLPENSGEFLKELKDQVALLVDNSRNLNNAIKAAKKLSRSADKTVKSAVKLLRSAIKSTYIVDQDYSQYLDELLDEAATGENIETVWPLLKQELANFTLTNDLAKDTNINENGLLEATKNLRQLQSDLTDLEAELNARNIIVNRFQSIIDDYNAQKAQEVAQQENLNKIMSTADKGIPTYSTDDVYEPQPKKMVNVLPRTTLGIDSDSDYFKGEEIKEHQVRANQFGLDLESFNNRDKIRGVYVTSKTQNQLLPGVTEKMLDNDQSIIDQFKDSIIVMVMVDETGLPVGVDGKPIPEGASLLENAIFQSIAEEGFSNGTMFRDGTPQETKDFINAEYKKFRDGILAQETLGVPVNVSASFGIPQFELDSKGNKIYTTTTSVKDAGLITDSDLESSLLLDVPTTNKTNSKGTTQYTSALGSVFLELKNGLVRLKNRKHTAKDASAIYDSILQLSKNLLTAEGINSTSSSRILDFLRGVTYWGIPANEAGNNSVFFEKSKDGKLMLRLSNNGVTFMFTPSALERNKDQIVKTLEGMFNNVNRSKTQDINQKFEQIISVSPEGDIESVVWPNYQSYLLSSKGRRDFELPLYTLMKPKVEGESNRKGVYFINNDTADNFEIPEPSSQATNIPIRRSETYVIDGNTVNTYTSPNTGKKILFKIKLVDDSIVKNGIEILPGGNLSEFRAKNITDDQLKAVIIDSIKPGMIKKTAQEAYKKQVDPVTPAPTQQTSEVKTIKRNLVDIETPITEFEPAVQELFNSTNPTVELYENIVANYEYDLEAELSPSLRKSIEAMLRDVKKSFTISQPTQQTSEVEIQDKQSSLKPAKPTSELDSLNDLINKRISDVNSVELGGLIKEKMNVNLDRFDSSDVQDLLLKGLSKKEIEEILIKKCKD
uniref:Uncharacterized protein n=1 Tax=Virus NIOZ-UU157 TaxID=2763269 RepID=A0A7S9SUE6_9VIRU|nr:MAG: hypothetical protein NIOZUU157_00358 [Virus NIOZ-UU157]